ncbi:calcium-translocating P-type ATPase, PMCA-type [Oscillospiraceae bacterium CLA-AA-H232]|uniref:P-type Ca(2+) transporter n=2 Tax=Oscillospiraceae TaxID=216572 RepID=A0AAE3J9T5_9FIRM|nr:calcium-translocating P-type ATPase, PMCA-type [Hominilimicola fabiformis]MCC2211253.1 calcium-translocating P-type ATPase, PMCA-type [Hominilimicola fabiformis]
MKKEDVLKMLGTDENGLTQNQAKENQKKYGKNELAEGKKKNPFILFLEQYKDFLVIILIIAAIISGVLGDIESAIVIFVVITINAILGTVQHIKAEQSLDSLKEMSAPTAKVIRDGEIKVVEGKDVTVGDVVVIEAGDYVCSDGRIIENASLKVDESAMTGESEPVEKQETVLDGEKPLGDRVNMLYSGSFATYGRAKMVVTSVGMETEIGKIASLLKSTQEKKTPLQESLDNFGKKLSLIIIGICVIVLGLELFRSDGINLTVFTDAFVFAVALAVAAIPEALSSIVTIVLSVGTQKLAKENAIIRKLQAVEGLGSVSIICSDKTGTLTQNKMTVQKIYFDGQIIDKDDEINARQGQLIIDGALCNDSVQKEGQEIGDPTEIALVNFSEKHDLPVEKMREKYQRLGEIPFDSDRKLMSTVHKIGDNYKMLTKGAVDVLSGRIDEVKTMDGKRPFTAEDLAELKKVNTEFSQMGLRVLAVCERDVDTVDISVDDEKDYILLGLVAMQDPPREESAEAVRKCKTAGIRPIMITGDHLVTASAIARKIGILDDNGRAVEGREIENLSDEELDEFVSDVSVYARVSPEHKIRIVSAWQRKGYIVSMTGDGVNDAPALKQADIGVAMGITGSEVAKDAASMVLTDDNFATIVKAIENGRNLYRNIQRAIQFLLSGNTAGILAVLYASFMALPVPFKAVHLLFINLLTDSLPAIALGVEPHSSDVMNEKPRPKNQSILTKKVLTNICVEGIVIGVMTMIAFYVGFLRNAEVASTMAFSTLCLSRLVHGFNCKSDKPVWFTKKMWNNKSMIGAFFVGFVLLNAVLLVPALQGIFAVAPLTIAELLTVYGLSLGTFVIVQILKMIRK